MNVKQKKQRLQKIQRKYLQLRDQLWPDIDQDMLWNWKKKAGFATIPRTIPHIQRIMDEMSSGKPVSSAYLALWCRLFDENAMVVIDNQDRMAFESGFSGQRAVTTWKARMKKLVELGFIDTQEGASGEYNYVLMWNPYRVIRNHLDSKVIPRNAAYNALLDRAMEIGAESDLTTK